MQTLVLLFKRFRVRRCLGAEERAIPPRRRDRVIAIRECGGPIAIPAIAALSRGNDFQTEQPRMKAGSQARILNRACMVTEQVFPVHASPRAGVTVNSAGKEHSRGGDS